MLCQINSIFNADNSSIVLVASNSKISKSCDRYKLILKPVKPLKSLINPNPRMIHSLTQYANNCELKINELCDEVEDMRDRLGLEPQQPFSIEGSAYRKGLSVQKDKSLNKVLQQEVWIFIMSFFNYFVWLDFQ